MFPPAAESSSQAIVFSRRAQWWTLVSGDARWLAAVAVAYGALVILTVLTLHPYFSQTWDVVTFVKAGQTLRSPDWLALYAQSRADRFWPYAYPPAHALLVAPLLAFAGFVPDWLLARVPPLLFDLALGALVYAIVVQATRSRGAARLAASVWLLNPVTWYDTAVQGHFEAEWLVFVVLAYWLAGEGRAWLWPSLALGAALLFKQNAILFALPFWARLLFGPGEISFWPRVRAVVGSTLIVVLPVAVLSLPFLLYSNDFWYMTVAYVADVPLQTQSWLVALAALAPDNALLAANTLLVLASAVLVALGTARRRQSLWLGGLLIALAFVLLSKKVVGYYYVMLLPFALVELVPARRFGLLAAVVAAAALISLSPYFASWADPAHAWVYALAGVGYSLFWLAVFARLWRHPAPASPDAQAARLPVFLSVALFLVATSAALVQPLIASATSPIRAPLVAPGAEGATLTAFGLFAGLGLLAMLASRAFAARVAREGRVGAGAAALVVLLAPLFFLTFALTKEATAALELALHSVGL